MYRQLNSLKESFLSTRADNFVKYCVSIAKEFQSRISRMRVFVKNNLASGTANEIILREFLAKHASGNFHVGQGFICDPSESNVVSKQCDILVYSQNHYPVVYSEGSIKVVWPESVAMVVEVKTNFTKKDILSALDNIASAQQLRQFLTGVIFAFRSPKLETVVSHLQSYHHNTDPNYLPTAILLLDKGIIIHSWGWSRQRDFDVAEDKTSKLKMYAVRSGKKDKGAVVVTFLLLLFFQAMEIGLLESEFINMLLEMLDEYTEKKFPDIDIGAAIYGEDLG